MEEAELIEYVKNRLQEPGCYAHDLSHIMRVYKNAKILHEKEGGDWSVIGPAVLLHDISREVEDFMSGKTEHGEEGAKVAKELGYNEAVQKCIQRHSSNGKEKPETIEEKILWDADKMDGWGAKGLARWFILEGEQNRTSIEAAERYLQGGKIGGRWEVETDDLDEIVDAWFFTDTAKKKGKEEAEYAIDFCRKVLE